MLLFPAAFLGVLNIDEWIWFFFWALFIVVFYEHFLDTKHYSYRISHRVWCGIVFGILMSAGVIASFLVTPELIDIQYAYLLVGGAAVLPALYTMFRYPTIIPKLIFLIPFFFCVYLAFELIALHFGWWSFDGNYVSLVTILGLTFALEELVIWIILGSAVVAAYHELLVDDQR
ncbi:MAG TPA: hypothetical protein VI957_02895 [Candidatus Paceibacterota bacterium]